MRVKAIKLSRQCIPPTGTAIGGSLLRRPRELADIPHHYLKEIEHFFRVYKDLEGTHTETRGFEGAAAARTAITRAMDWYQERFRGEK